MKNEEVNDPQIRAFRAMTPAQRLAAAADLYWSARRLKTAAVRSFHPDWSEDEVRQHVKELFLYGAA
jgi:hypothetical protein